MNSTYVNQGVGAMHGWAFWGSTPLPSGTGVEKQGVATKFYGLGIMNIAPLRGMIDLTTRVWVRSLGTILGRC